MTDLTCKQAGRKGGLATVAKYGGTDHFSRIGKLAPTPPLAVLRAMAVKGGAATKATHDRAWYAAMGKRGGETLLERRGRGYYADIGRLGAAARAARLREQRGGAADGALD